MISRAVFRQCVWRPALVRAGLLGKVVQAEPGKYRASWMDSSGKEHNAAVATEREAIKEIARRASDALRFHDLRHSYATWLVSDGVPVNDVQRVMGHEQTTTMLNLHTHGSGELRSRIRGTLDAFSLRRTEEGGGKRKDGS